MFSIACLSSRGLEPKFDYYISRCLLKTGIGFLKLGIIFNFEIDSVIYFFQQTRVDNLLYSRHGARRHRHRRELDGWGAALERLCLMLAAVKSVLEAIINRVT